MTSLNNLEKNSQPTAKSDFIINRFTPTNLYVKESENFHTRLCIYNYFSEIFPNVKTGATVHLWFFDSSGKFLAYRKIPLEYKGQLQFEVSELGLNFEGTVGLSLIPETIPNFKPPRVGTGYYAYYYDDKGHADLSHEWGKMTFEKTQSEPWLCVIRPSIFPNTQLIIMNSYYGWDDKEGTSRYVIRIRNNQGKVLTEKKMAPIPPKGCLRVSISEIFPNIGTLAKKEGTFAVEVIGSNIKGPFTWVTIPGGDFNIHHFC